MKEYIEVGKLNRELFEKLNINIIVDEVIITFERIKHIEDRRFQLYEQVKEILPIAIYDPDYIYKDWNNRNDTLVFIKNIDNKQKLNIIIKIALRSDEKHPKNAIITMIKIGNKTFKKICNNKTENLLHKKLDKDE